MSISIVMPVYNEEETIEKVIRQYYSKIITSIAGSELIVVNDGSTDRTPAIIQRLAKEFPLLRIVNLEPNRGHSTALRAGFDTARNPCIFHVDSDDQFKVEDFYRLYPLVRNNDIVLGWRNPRRDPVHRKVVALMLRIITIALFGIAIKDINSPFKFIKTRVLRDIVDHVPPNSFAFSILILLLAKRKGYQIVEVPIAHFARTTGKSKLANSMYLLKGCALCFLEILWLRRQTLFKKGFASNGI